jgi:uncharacterized protein (TIGR02246 family)
MLVAGLTALLLSLAASAEDCARIDAKSVTTLFDDWNYALSSLDANQVTSRYWPNAVLLTTASNTPRTTPAMITDYFEHFLVQRPRGRIDSRTVTLGCNIAVDVGTYTFSLMTDKGAVSEVAARYSFVYQYHDGAWKILHQHSSAMPENAVAASPSIVADAAPAPPPAPVHVAPAAPPRPKPTKAEAVKPMAKPTPAASAQAAVQSAAANDIRTSMFANLSSSAPPSKFYPAESRSHREHGNVNLRVCANDTGQIHGDPEVLKSSGSKLLDEAARSWARAASWVPATLNLKRVEGCTLVEVAFEPAA